MDAYYKRVYPHQMVHRLLSVLDATKSSELVLRVSKEREPMRYLDPSNITSLLCVNAPRDGAHLALSERCTTTLALDVDLSAPRGMYCSCAAGGRLICDNCWVAMAGVLAGYVYMLRSFFGCTQLLACFSGGRGWHLFVLDAQRIDRIQTTHMLEQLVPRTAAQIAGWFMELVASRDNLYTLDIFDPAHRVSKVPGAEQSAKWAHTVTDGRVLALYTDVLLPYFCHQWRPRVLGCNVGENEATQVAGALLAAHSVHKTPQCHLCTVARAYSKAAEQIATVRETRSADSLPPLAKRIDAFLAITALLWEEPDPNLMSARHPIRLPWSPHERSGRFSLPLPLTRAHELCPMSQPPLWSEVGTRGTTGDAWFRLSLDVVADLLGDCERTPSVAVWPT